MAAESVETTPLSVRFLGFLGEFRCGSGVGGPVDIAQRLAEWGHGLRGGPKLCLPPVARVTAPENHSPEGTSAAQWRAPYERRPVRAQ
jgi:hypothetical protein